MGRGCWIGREAVQVHVQDQEPDSTQIDEQRQVGETLPETEVAGLHRSTYVSQHLSTDQMPDVVVEGSHLPQLWKRTVLGRNLEVNKVSAHDVADHQVSEVMFEVVANENVFVALERLRQDR